MTNDVTADVVSMENERRENDLMKKRGFDFSAAMDRWTDSCFKLITFAGIFI